MSRRTWPPGPRIPPPLQTARFVKRPTSFLDACEREFGRVFTLNLQPVGRAVHLTSPEAAKAVFMADRSNQLNPGRTFLLEPLLGARSILLQVGQEHLRRRRLMLPPFHGERMRSYEQVIVDATGAAVARWPRGRAFPLLEEMQSITLDVILRAVFGLRPGARADEIRALLATTLAEANRIGPQLSLALVGPRLRGRHPVGRRIARVQRLLVDEITERRLASDLETREDILSLLVVARDEDGEPLGDEELRDQLMTLLVAGHETTATGLAWAFDALFRTPAAMSRLRDSLRGGGDDAYLAAVVDEAMRVRPVIPEVGRRLGEPLEVDGVRLEAGTDVLVSIQQLHRNPTLFEDPLAFRPERFLDGPVSTYAWVPFGGGMRRCLGAAFAQLEMRVVLREVLSSVDLRPGTDRAEPIVRRPVTLAPGNGTPALVA
jgi:cytochrome P450